MSETITKYETGAVASRDDGMEVSAVVGRVNKVQRIMREIMKEDTHYGRLPGCGNKQVLLKPGADLLAMAFRLSPEYRVQRSDMDMGHREYEVTCVMRGGDGTVIGEGVGSACTMEKRYRYVQGKEREDIADTYNTVLKQAKKRAHVDATLTCTGASDMFTQDMIDEDDAADHPDIPSPVAKPRPSRAAKPAPAQPSEPAVGIGIIDNVETATGKKKNGTDWTKYGITIDGRTFGTFSESLGLLAQNNIGSECCYKFEQDGKFTTLTELEIAPVQGDELPLDEF